MKTKEGMIIVHKDEVEVVDYGNSLHYELFHTEEEMKKHLERYKKIHDLLGKNYPETIEEAKQLVDADIWEDVDLQLFEEAKQNETLCGETKQITKEQAFDRLLKNKPVWAWKRSDELSSMMRFYCDVPPDDVIKKESKSQDCEIYECILADASTFFSCDDVLHSMETSMMLHGFEYSCIEIKLDKKAFEEYVKQHITLNGQKRVIAFEIKEVKKFS